MASIDDKVERPKYKQPHNIKLYGLPKIYHDNPALKYHLIMKEHHRMKYNARWLKSKQNK